MSPENVKFTTTEFDVRDIESLERDELKWRQEVADHANNPNLVRFYCDGPHHGNAEAEFAFRSAFNKAAAETLALFDLSSAEEIGDELYSLERSALKARQDAKAAAMVGRHHHAYRAGHEIEAARTRGRVHGLISAVHLFEQIEAGIKESGPDRELSDQEFDTQQKQIHVLFRGHLFGFRQWVEQVQAWAAAGYDKPEVMSYHFETCHIYRTTGEFFAPKKIYNCSFNSAATMPDTSDSLEDTVKRARAYLKPIPGAVSGQHGHDHTFKTTLKLVAFGLPRSLTFECLNEWNQTCLPPWSEKDLWHKIDDAIKANPTPHADRPLDNPIPSNLSGDYFGPGATQSTTSNAKQPEQLPRLIIRKAGELIRDFPQLRPAILEGLLRRGETMNIIAAPKVGKSWLSMGLALTVATGGKWLGRFWTKPGKVLIVDNELHADTTSYRLPQIAEAMGITQEKYADRLSVANLRGSLVDIDRLATELSALSPGEFDLIILDAWYRFQPSGSDENNNGDVSRLYNVLDSVSHKIGCAFACVHHTSKGNQAGKGVTDVGAGAGAQARAPDAHLALRQHEQDGAVVVEAAVRSWAPMEPFCLRWKFPVWEPADDLDPKALRQERPRTAKKQADESGLTAQDKKRMADEDRRKRVLMAISNYPDGESRNVIKTDSGLNANYFGPVFAELQHEGLVIECEVKKSRRTFRGFKLNPDFVTRTLGHSDENHDVSELSDNAGIHTRTTAPPLGGSVRPSISSVPSGYPKKRSEIRALSDQELDRADNLFGSQSA